MCSDILQARQEKRFAVRMVAVVTHQRAGIALPVVILVPRETVIDEQHGALAEDTAPGLSLIHIFWESCRLRYAQDGPFLFGSFSIADAMYSPVVWRFLTYAVELPPASRAWIESMRLLPAMQEWRGAALADMAS